MNRRTAIRQLFVVAGGIIIASSCSSDVGGSSIQLNTIRLTAKDEALLADLVEAIIPSSDSPGAKELNLHLFVMKMVDDCSDPEEQEQFIAGLKSAKKLEGKSTDEILAYLEELPKDDVFLHLLKRRTIQGYMNSEYVMKNKLVYELIPGRYNGAVKIEA
ncbi:gluconate 2-dehydrogenase subunit 3 family protein [Sphingobacterium lumbrici]|uniref:gluconate 2-dehydrogenase subunit 3 family protein n=1 Tax=Sphingobacterium lumbrici TaxID=2559600 RepID=UPI00112ABE0E|nr:gluconate 2-dehydrogenase subunit 3 family protein [Sphingobacterium lumbrici]